MKKLIETIRDSFNKTTTAVNESGYILHTQALNPVSFYYVNRAAL